MNRTEAAAKAQYEAVTGRPWESAPELSARLCRDDSAAIAAAIDAHDAEQGIHRVTLDEAAVERATEVGMATHDWQMFECPEIPGGMDAAEAVAEAIRAVIAALKGSGQ